MKVVIIGGGSAGTAAATHLRRRDENAEIVILEKSGEFATSTCGLPYLLSGTVRNKDDLTGATVEQMRDTFKIDVRLNHEVVNIDRKSKYIAIQEKKGENYDKLILATGALQMRSDIPGILGDNIFTIRNLESVERIKDYYLGTNAQKVLILGAGDIGVEAAEAFCNLGADVVIIDKEAHILPHFDPEMVLRAEQELCAQDIRLCLGRTVSSFAETQAILDDGTVIDFDLAIIATGVKPDVKLPVMANLGIGENGGILVNKYMQTNDENIYACGDNVEILSLITQKPQRWPSAELALKEARVAADHIVGIDSSFAAIVGTSISKIFSYTAAMAGCNEKQLDLAGIKYHKIYLLQNNRAGYLPGASQMQFKLLFAPNGQILGIQGCGKDGIDKRVDAIAHIIRAKGSYLDMLFAETCYAPPFGVGKDAINNLGSLAEGVLSGQIRYWDWDKINWQEAGTGFLPVDVRTPKDFQAGHLPQAVNFPLPGLRENMSSLPRDKNILLYCNRGYGAFLAYCIMNQRGFDNVFLLNTPFDLVADKIV